MPNARAGFFTMHFLLPKRHLVSYIHLPRIICYATINYGTTDRCGTAHTLPPSSNVSNVWVVATLTMLVLSLAVLGVLVVILWRRLSAIGAPLPSVSWLQLKDKNEDDTQVLGGADSA